MFRPQAGAAVGDEEDIEGAGTGCTLFVKNLNFATTDETLRTTFEHVGVVRYEGYKGYEGRRFWPSDFSHLFFHDTCHVFYGVTTMTSLL